MIRVIGFLVNLIFWACMVAITTAQGRANQATSFQSQEVKFDGKGLTLAGTLLVPKINAGNRAPAVLIIADYGPVARDGVNFGNVQHTIYRDLAEHLAGRGMIVLRFDKRCVGTSECKTAESFDDYVDDARGGINFLRKNSQVDQARIFLFGHGEGALIAASFAAHYQEKFAGIVLAAMAGRTLGKVIREEIQNRRNEAGRPANEINTYLVKYDRVIRGLMSGRSEFFDEKFDPKDPDDKILLGLIAQHQVVMSLLINDPLQIVSNIKSPVLILQGKKDIQVRVKDAQFIEEALKRTYHPDMTMQLLDDVDHLLKTNKGTGNLASYGDASRPLDPVMLTILSEWMEKRSKKEI